MKKLLISALLAIPVLSFANIVTLDFNDTGCASAINDIDGALTLNQRQAICADLKLKLTDAVNQDFPDTDISGYAKSIANASSLANAGKSDYSDKFKYFVVKPSFGGAVAAENLEKPEESAGVGFSGNMVIGLNLDLLPVDKFSFIEFKKMDLFVNFFSLNLDQNFGEIDFKGDISSLGLFARYHIYEPEEGWDSGLFQWAGLFVHTGFQRSSSKLNISSNIDLGNGVDIPGPGNTTFTGTIDNAVADFTMENTTTTIPIEVSTYAKFLYAFTLYGGLGLDIVSGKTEITSDSKGDLKVQGSNSSLGTLNAFNDPVSGEAEASNLRGFLGLQLNLPFFRIYGQLQNSFSQDAIGGNIGLKVLW